VRGSDSVDDICGNSRLAIMRKYSSAPTGLEQQIKPTTRLQRVPFANHQFSVSAPRIQQVVQTGSWLTINQCNLQTRVLASFRRSVLDAAGATASSQPPQDAATGSVTKLGQSRYEAADQPQGFGDVGRRGGRATTRRVQARPLRPSSSVRAR
jgi:hypothetical protein